MESFNPLRITMFKSGEEHYNGLKVVVTHRLYKNWESFLLDLSKKIDLKGGAVRRLYTINGTEIKGFKELVDKERYVASTGIFIQCDYTEVKRKSSIVLVQEPVAKIQTKSVFSPDSKGIRIYVYIEGNTLDVPKKLVLNYRNCKSFEQMLEYLSSELKADHGTIKSIFDSKSFNQIVTMEDLFDGANIVAISNPKMVKPRDSYQYPLVTNEKQSTQQSVEDENTKLVKDIKLQKENVKKDNIFEYGGRGIRLFAYLSGYDKIKPKIITLNWRNCKNFDQFLNILSFALKPAQGPVRLVFALDLKTQISNTSELVDGQTIVCVANTLEKTPKDGNYEPLSLQTTSRPATATNKDQKIITIYPNGDANHTGLKISISLFRFKTLNKLTELLDAQLKLNSGKVSILYEFKPQVDSHEQLNNKTSMKVSNVTKVSTIEQVIESESSHFVAATSQEPFRNIQYNTNGIEKALKTAASIQKTNKIAN